MGQMFIDSLKSFLEKYTAEQIQKILACLTLAMLKIRKHPDFMLECVTATSHIRDEILKVIRDETLPDAGLVKAEMFNLVQGILSFPNLDDTEVVEIECYCLGIMPVNNDSLEKFLAGRFDAASSEPSLSHVYLPADLVTQAARLETAKGFYQERFVLRPTAKLSDRTIFDAIASFYLDKGYAEYTRNDIAVVMENPDECLNIAITNSGDTVHVSVNAL